MQLFYNPEIDSNTQQILFSKEESRHIIRVLRKKEFDVLDITNGRDYLFKAEIQIASDKKCIANIISVEKKEKTWPYYLHIAIAPTKNIDRFEWFLEKATEIGIDEITPILCQNSERKVIKQERLEKIVQSAMKQSLKYRIPKLNKLTSLSDFMESIESNSVYMAHCEDCPKKSLKDITFSNNPITILIGPEGDFSNDEINTYKNKTEFISLGESRLRTETAGLVAVQSISFLHQ